MIVILRPGVSSWTVAMGLFGPKFIFDEGTTDWIFDTYSWALESFGTDVFFQFTDLVLPDDKFFPDKLEDTDDIAEGLFTKVRKYAGMEEWPCRLVAQEEDINPVVGPTLLIQGAPSGPAGTFSITGGKSPIVEISYNPSQLGRPESLIATFAHELAHYLIHTVDTPPPGGEEFEEYATDLVAVFLGFGVFLANSAFNFSQYTDVDSQGWQTFAQGYLSEPELTYCLAIFLHLKNMDHESVEPYLDKNLRGTLKAAENELKHLSEEITKLRSIKSNKTAQPGL